MLMQLTDLEGRPVGLNPEHFISVRINGFGVTQAFVSDGKACTLCEVRETVEEVIAKVNGFWNLNETLRPGESPTEVMERMLGINNLKGEQDA